MADIDALRDLVFANQIFAKGMVRIRVDENSDWENYELPVTVTQQKSGRKMIAVELYTSPQYGW